MRLLNARSATAIALVVAWLVAPVAPVRATPTPPPPVSLTVDGLSTPLGVDDVPAFAWRLVDRRRGAAQTAYRVVVTTHPSAAGARAHLVWDSGRVASAQQSFVSYLGVALPSDSSFQWTVQVWDQHGVRSAFAGPATFATGLHDADWRAKWIRRITPGAQDPDEYTFARREMSLSTSPITRARAFVSASQQGELWLNGVRVAKGPAFSYPSEQYYQAVDVTSAVHSGVNAVGAIYHWYGPGQGRPKSAPGFIAQVVVDHADGTHELIVTDERWRVHSAPWLPAKLRNTDSHDFEESIDGPAWPMGWDRPGFNDSSWAAATSLGRHPVAPFTHLTWQRNRIIESPQPARSLSKLPNGSYVADFGAVIAAVPTVTFHHGVLGRVIPMHAGYVLDRAGQTPPAVPGGVSTTHRHEHTDMRYSYVQRFGEQTFHPFSYLGFRYLQIDNPGEALTKGDVVALVRHNEMPDENAATFHSPNATLNAIWALARHSALGSSQEQFLDTTTREKGPFAEDYVSRTTMRAFGEQNLTRQVLLEFAASQARYWPDGRINAVYPNGDGKRDIPDGTETYPMWLWTYYQNTGDLQLLRRLYPVAAHIAGYVRRAIPSATGLVTNLPGGSGDYQYGIIDWPKPMRYGFDMNTVVRTPINAWAVNVFRSTALIASALGRPSTEVGRYTSAADRLITAMNARLRRGDGVYIDGLHADGSQSTHASQQANSSALRFGVSPADTAGTVGAYIAHLGMRSGPATVESVMRGLDAVGRDADLVALLTNVRADGYANVLSRGATWTWESWRPQDSDGDSIAHAFGVQAVVVMQEAFLGVRPEAPAWRSFTVRPPKSGLDAAEGRAPTPSGPVLVSWQRGSDRHTFALDVTVPPNTQAAIYVPASRPGAVTEGGRPAATSPQVQFLRMDNGAAVFAVGAGSYHFLSR